MLVVGLKRKSIENKTVANLCLDKEHYNAACTHYYYSIYQKIVWIKNKKKLNNAFGEYKQQQKEKIKANKKGYGNHELLLYFMQAKLNEFVNKTVKPNNFKAVDIAKFIAETIKLKELRTTADYYDEDITHLQALKAYVYHDTLEKMYAIIEDVWLKGGKKT